MTSLTLYIFIEVPSAADKMESHGVNILRLYNGLQFFSKITVKAPWLKISSK
jgi:hypothetical protein